MNITEILNGKAGEYVSFKGILTDKQLIEKNGGGNYLSITLADARARISTPIFENVEDRNERLVIGKPYLITATINVWNSTVQLKNVKFKELKEDEYNSEEFIDSYSVDGHIGEIVDIIMSMEEPYKTIAEHALGLAIDPEKETVMIVENSERWTNFSQCPSAEKYHGNKIGGLLLHTLGVTENIVNVIDLYQNNITEYGDVTKVINVSRLKLKAIIHDCMKTKEYEYDTFIRRKPNVVGHVYDGVAYIDSINKECGNILSEEDVENIKTCILSHHGQYGPMQPKTLEDTLVHLADMIDSRVVGEMENNN